MTPPICIILYQHLKLLSKIKMTNPLRKDERSTQQSVDKRQIYQYCKICLTIRAVLHCKVTLQLHILLQRVRDIVVVGVVIVTLSANVTGERLRSTYATNCFLAHRTRVTGLVALTSGNLTFPAFCSSNLHVCFLEHPSCGRSHVHGSFLCIWFAQLVGQLQDKLPACDRDSSRLLVQDPGIDGCKVQNVIKDLYRPPTR